MVRVVQRWIIVGTVALLLGACSSTEPSTPLPQGPIVPTRAPVTPAPTATIVASNAIPQLVFGESITGEIRGSNVENRYVFEASSGDVIVIRMQATSGDLDSYLILEGPDGEEIARNDDEDSERGFDAGLIDIRLPETGLYTIIASRFNPVVGTTEGDYTLTLERGILSPEATPQPEANAESDEAQAEVLLPGSQVTGTLDHAVFFQHYALEIEAEQTITIVMRAGETSELDPLLIMRGPDGREIARDDPTTDGAHIAQIANLTLQEPGQYTLVASRFGGHIGRSNGSYTLSVQQGDADAQPLGILARPIGYGTSVSGEISESTSRHVYTFEGNAADVISLVSTAADAATLDTFMTLFDANGNEIARNDDNVFASDPDESFNAAIFFQPLPTDGFYSVLISRFGRGEGIYALELRLEARGDPKIGRLYLGTVEPSASFGQLADGARLTLFAVGDWVAGRNEEDTVVSALITFMLPELAPETQPSSVLLDLSSCLLSGSNVFESAGVVSLYVNNTFDTIDAIEDGIIRDTPLAAQMNDCEIVDVTDFVQDAYVAGQRVIQFRLALEAEALRGNGISDAVVFPYPRLEVTLD